MAASAVATPVRFIPRSTSTSTPILTPAAIGRLAHRADLVRMVDGDLDVGLVLEGRQPRHLAGPDDKVGDQDVVDPAGGHHLGLGNLGHGHPDRACPADEVSDRRTLVRLGMRTPRHATLVGSGRPSGRCCAGGDPGRARGPAYPARTPADRLD